MIAAGYEENPTMHEYLFYSVISRRLQITYQEGHINSRTEDFTTLKEIEKITEKKVQLQTTLDKQRENKQKTLDVVDLHYQMIDAAKKAIRNNIGEHSFRCKKCGEMVNAQGLPHWAIETKAGSDGSPVHYVFSPELWYLMKKKKLAPHVVAFILRTSVEGLLFTAKERGEENIPTVNLDKEETDIRKIMEDFHYETH